MNTVPEKVLDVLSSSTTGLKSITNSISNATTQPILNCGIGSMIRDANAAVISIFENSEEPEKCDTPNEYRNLLMSLSGNKSDHILWIQCLKKYSWHGNNNSEFSFELDKFGVPVLKNGNYTINLCYNCLDKVIERQKNDENSSPYDGFSFLWEGNYWDSCESTANDFTHLTAESVLIVVNKVANVIQKLLTKTNDNTDQNNTDDQKTTTKKEVKGRSIFVYMPNVVQLFIVQMAAARVGAIMTFINAALNYKAEDLADVLKISSAELVITIDGFFIGNELQSSKKILDEAIEILHSKLKFNQINKVVIIKHIGPNPNIPPPSVPLPMGKRPHYGFEISFQPERDFYWSDLILEASEFCECEWMESEDILFNSVKKISEDNKKNDNNLTGVHSSNSSKNDELNNNSTWILESYTVGQIALLVQLLSKTLRSSSQGIFSNIELIWPLIEEKNLLFLTSLFAIPLAEFDLLLCESPPTYPNPNRILDIIQKFNVKQLLITNSYTKFLIRNDDFQNLWFQAENPTWNISSLEMIYTVSELRSENEECTQWFQNCIPTANIMHLSC